MTIPPPRTPGRPGAAAADESAQKAARHQTDQLAEEARAVEEELEALKVKYEQYFLGVERREPNRWRDAVKKKVLRLKDAFTRNTGLKFKVQSLHARFISYERLWQRSAREKEEGTYRRDLFKARLHAREAAKPAPGEPQGERALAANPGTVAQPGAAAAPPPAPTKPAQAAPRPPTPAPGDDPKIRALFDAYVAAKRRCNEDVSRITYEALARSVAKQIPELKARYNAKSVDFRVEVKDGRAVLKATPKV